MKRPRPQYQEPGSFDRVLEAGIALADADSDDDGDWHSARVRLRQAVNAHAAKALGAKGGKARAARMTPEQRREAALRMVEARRLKRAQRSAT